MVYSYGKFARLVSSYSNLDITLYFKNAVAPFVCLKITVVKKFEILPNQSNFVYNLIYKIARSSLYSS